MPPKRNPPPPPQVGRGTQQQAAVYLSELAAEDAIQARVKKLDKDVKECRKLYEMITRKQRDDYIFSSGALCEINPGTYLICHPIIKSLCANHEAVSDPKYSKSILLLEKHRDKIKANAFEKNGTLSEREHELHLCEVQAAQVLRNSPSVHTLLDNTFHVEVRKNLDMMRLRTYPVVPPVTPEQRANAMSHTNLKTLKRSYIDSIYASVVQPHLAEHHLENAIKEVPGCHIAWRLLALILVEKPLVKTKLEERIAERLVPLGHYAKVVQLLPKDVNAWWNIAKLLFTMEEDFLGDEKLRSLIFITVNGKKYSSWDCFVRVLELEPNVPVYWMHLGKSMLRSHHPFALGERLVTIAFEGGPTMTEVSARYCYEAYLRINPDVAKEFMPWLYVARAMLNERDVTADVDDAFTSVEVDNGANTLTRPQVLARMVDADPTNSEMWLFLFRALAEEPDSYRLHLKVDVKVNGIHTNILTQTDCLIRAIELDVGRAGSWVMMYDLLHRRDAMRIALHQASPQPDDDSDDEDRSSLTTCRIFGKHFNKIDCLLKSHQLTILQKESATSERDGLISYDQPHYNTWMIVAVEGVANPSGMFALPQGMETIPNYGGFKSGTNNVWFVEALIKVYTESKTWSCDIRLRLLQLLRASSDDIRRMWPEAGMLYDSIENLCVCFEGCPSCRVLTAFSIKLKSTSASNAHIEYLRANLNVSANLDPETWYELGKILLPREKVTLFANDESSREYTRIDCFRQAIESPKRWNRAGSWLALGNALNKGEVLNVHGKPHSREDCFKQARLWFDEKPNDQLMALLTQKAPVAHPILQSNLANEDEEEEEEESDVAEEDSEDTMATVEEKSDDPDPDADPTIITEEEDEEEAETEIPVRKGEDVAALNPRESSEEATQLSVSNRETARNAHVDNSPPLGPLKESEAEVSPPASTATEDDGPGSAASNNPEKEADISVDTVVNSVIHHQMGAPLQGEVEGTRISAVTSESDVVAVDNGKDTHTEPFPSATQHSMTSTATTTTALSSSTPMMTAPSVRSAWAALMAVQGGLSALKTLSQGGGINQ